MPFFPKLRGNSPTKEFLDTFGGYDHNLKIGDGMWYDEENMTAEHFPLLATRHKRGVVQSFTKPLGIITKDTLAYVDGHSLYYNGDKIEGLVLSDDGPKQMISMGAYLLIWPDKVWLNTVNMTEWGYMEQRNTTAAAVKVTLTQRDGTGYATIVTVAPDSPADGALWMDVSDDTPVLKKWSAQSGMWVSIPTTYLKIECANIGAGLSKGDGVSISGFTADLASLNGSFVVEAAEDGYIVVIGIVKGNEFTETGEVKVERTVPEMDYVCESGNRVWGCKYGFVNGKTVNEIYASKLGDFKNWNVFQGLSTDSYVASRGSDGQFTGAIAHLGYPLFFKENCLEKVYPSATGAHQIVTTECRGVQKGCWRSLQIVNETLYYKSREGVCAYTGALPVGVSSAFGDVKYSDARGGALGNRYFISMTSDDGWSLFTYDTAKKLWHREDDTCAMFFTEKDGELYFIDEGDNTLRCVMGTDGEKEEDFEWSVESGVIGFEDSEHKYLSHFVFRAALAPGACLHLDILYDEDKAWTKRGTYNNCGLRSFVLPVMPRRCDHLRFRLRGKGEMKLYSIAKIKEKGSDAAWR
ncbi:MAG: hypothetical protein J6J01_06775 [Oscillospiraceae bacterium]|nr:hypothetical protein [Oscillospiraceae bacterium]